MASRNTSSAAADARARARQMQVEQQQKARRRRTWTIWGSVLAAVLVIALIVAFVVTNSKGTEVAASGPAPAAVNEQGGVTVTSGGALEDTGLGEREVDSSKVEVPEGDAKPEGPETVPASEPKDGEPAKIVLYADFDCVHCAEFEGANAEQIQQWVDDGKATVEYRILDFLSAPNNKNYSARSANAAYCVAAEKPEAYGEFVSGLFDAYEGHRGKGLSDDDLAQRAEAVGADVSDCIDDGTYRPAVAYATAKAKEAGVAGTPSVFVNGKSWALDGGDSSFQDWATPMIEG